MAQIQKFSEQMIQAAERLADVADAAEGKGRRSGNGGPGARWLLLPAAGAGLYALVTRGSFQRQAKDVLEQAKERAAELPEELLGRVQQTAGRSGNGRTSSSRLAQRSSSRKSTRRKATAAR
jgi:hypothetical protein